MTIVVSAAAALLAGSAAANVVLYRRGNQPPDADVPDAPPRPPEIRAPDPEPADREEAAPAARKCNPHKAAEMFVEWLRRPTATAYYQPHELDDAYEMFCEQFGVEPMSPTSFRSYVRGVRVNDRPAVTRGRYSPNAPACYAVGKLKAQRPYLYGIVSDADLWTPRVRLKGTARGRKAGDGLPTGATPAPQRPQAEAQPAESAINTGVTGGARAAERKAA